jgi:pyruvate/2-oxoglutarate dehydrogenase complex dihydrolipoamide acyltransferase (E2) component
MPARRRGGGGGDPRSAVTEIRMPKPGDAITEGVLAQCFVEDGGTVTEGEPLYLLETDKVEMQIDAPASGTVTWKVERGGTYDVGTLLAEIQ